MNKLLFFALHLFSVCGQAQSDISGTIKDSLEKRIDNVKGVFLFHSIPTGNYFVRSTYTGFTIDNSVPFSIVADRNTNNLCIFQLHENSTQFEEVKVVAKKPFLELKADRLVINVETRITSAGSTALQILVSSPEVIIDHQNNSISMIENDEIARSVMKKVF